MSRLAGLERSSWDRHRSGLTLFRVRTADREEEVVVGLTASQLSRLGLRPEGTYAADRLREHFSREAFFPVWVYAPGAGGRAFELIGRIPLFTDQLRAVERFTAAGVA